MTTPEFHRLVELRTIAGETVAISADEAERKALARRFGLVSIGRLEASVTLGMEGEVIDASGRLAASIIQSCAVSGDDLAVEIDEPLTFRFVPETPVDAEELELASDELDEIPYSGQSIDLGEAVAQSLALAIDPYLTGPNAEKARKDAGLLDENASGPFGALAALRNKED